MTTTPLPARTATAPRSGPTGSAPRRNILFLMTDQHRTDTLGAYGAPGGHTPHLDALAASGTRFDRFYTPTSICTPARASLLTGYAPFRHRLLANYERNVGYREDLADDQFTFTAPLADAGYRLGLIGKWHTGVRRVPADFGFEGPYLPGWHNPVTHPDYLAYLDAHDLPPYAVTDPVRTRLPGGGPGPLLAARLRQPVEATFEHYLATRAIELLHRWAEEPGTDGEHRTNGEPGTDEGHRADGEPGANGEHRGDTSPRPFFLAVHFFGPHLPYLLPDAYYDLVDPATVELPASLAETFEGKPPVQRNYSALWGHDSLTETEYRGLIAAYHGYVALIDLQIGRIRRAVDELGLTDSTAVVFTADHGEFTGSHRMHDKGPAMYEDVYRIPGLLQVPGAPAGVARREFATLTDVTATLLDLAGCDPAPAVDGRSLLPLTGGGPAPEDWPREVVGEFHGHHFPYPQRMLRDERYKIVINPESVCELYDLDRDPHELRNAWDDPALRDVRDHLVHRLHRLLSARGDNFHHWMAAVLDVGAPAGDTSLGSFESAAGAARTPAARDRGPDRAPDSGAVPDPAADSKEPR
ncbi:sulfatase-like hydrolase/transferase, partial [Streptomyces clavuligerus]|uniref:sulfatase-like hydrolase/transferase n=1 Tax=Streptomyces clavuligerus TaxID=1901 RepID=UPI0018D0C857